MAKLMSKKTREIVQTTAFLVLLALFIVFYIVYPLITMPDLTARADRDRFEEAEFTLENDPSFFIDLGLSPDTFSILTNDNLSLAALYFHPDPAIYDSVRGTVILLNDASSDRNSLAAYLTPLMDSGLAVVLYDQRATGQSNGIYHFGGDYEGEDLAEVIIRLNFIERLYHPVIVVGFGLGGDALLNAEREEVRIDYGIAVNPYLTTTNWIETLRKEHGILGIPLSNMVYFWWYQKLSGYPYPRSGPDDIPPLETGTLLLLGDDRLESDEASALVEISSPEILTVAPVPENPEEQVRLIINKIYSLL
ncbi:MAG: alpha/beta hydrolase [Candidatus Zixiibacteriota bacterium]|nr:MAG: alpha/beta hydrolase [candidate division Zixibacteria bacterium]